MNSLRKRSQQICRVVTLFAFLSSASCHQLPWTIPDQQSICNIPPKLPCSKLMLETNYTKPEKWQKYLSLIDSAVKNHKECDSRDCSCYDDVLDEDLSVWENNQNGGITETDFKNAKSYGVHYQIINKTLYRQNECPFYEHRAAGVEHFLLNVAKYVPDTEFIINYRDIPLTSKLSEIPLPVFSFSKTSPQHWDVMYPAWTFWGGGPVREPFYSNGLGRWDQQRINISREATMWPWKKKTGKGFFRGARTSSDRDPLVLFSRLQPELVEAKYTKNEKWLSDVDSLYEKPAPVVKLEDHCKYKYLFNLRGIAASFRLKYLFLCESLVFHVGDDWLEFFYSSLKPWVHYIPVQQNLSDVKELLLFAKENDKVAKQIADRGRTFIWDHLKMEDISCYWKKLLKRYSKLLKYKPERNKNFKLIIKKEVFYS